MNHPKIGFGEKTDEYPYGYGFCQCGCDGKTLEYASGYYRKFLPLHKYRHRNKQSDISRQIKIHGKNVDMNVLEDMYCKEKKSLRAIAQTLGCSETNIRRLFKVYNISSRSLSDARLEALKQGKLQGHNFHEFNEKFFQTWTPAMAWVLGLIYTDGYMRKNVIRLVMNDKDVILKVASHLDAKNSISIIKNGSNYSHCLNIYREQIANDLRSLGVHQAKSFSIKFPNMPSEYIRHFIRGCWDGDGGFSNSKGHFSAHYVSGSKDFIEVLAEELYERGVFRVILQQSKEFSYSQWSDEIKILKQKYPNGKYPLKISKRKNNKAYDIRVTNPQALSNLFLLLYEGVYEDIYMIRKFKKFSEYFRMLPRHELSLKVAKCIRNT